MNSELNYETNIEIIRHNIYNFLIDHYKIKKLAMETFKKADIVGEGYLSLEEIQKFIKIFLRTIKCSDLLSEQQIETIFKECIKNEEEDDKMNQDDFAVFL